MPISNGRAHDGTASRPSARSIGAAGRRSCCQRRSSKNLKIKTFPGTSLTLSRPAVDGGGHELTRHFTQWKGQWGCPGPIRTASCGWICLISAIPGSMSPRPFRSRKQITASVLLRKCWKWSYVPPWHGAVINLRRLIIARSDTRSRRIAEHCSLAGIKWHALCTERKCVR